MKTMDSAEFNAMKNSMKLAHDATMPFGPYQGMPICEVPLDYLDRIQHDVVLSDRPDIREIIKRWLDALAEKATA